MSEMHPLPKADYELKIKSQENLVGALQSLNGTLQAYLKANNDEVSGYAARSNITPPKEKTKRLVEYARNQVDLFHNIDELKLQQAWLEGMKNHYTYLWLPQYEREIQEAMAEWPAMWEKIQAHPEIKEKVDFEFNGKGWSINDPVSGDEVKMYYLYAAKTLFDQLEEKPEENLVQTT